MPVEPAPSPEPGYYLVWCLGRPQLTRVHASEAAAQRDAESLARAYPNSRIDVYALLSSHTVVSTHPYARAIAPPQSPPGTQHY